MKKGIIIALCSLAVLFVACKKPVTPESVDYTPNYVGNYIGQFTLNIDSINYQPQPLSLPIDGIGMEIAKAEEFNAIRALSAMPYVQTLDDVRTAKNNYSQSSLDN